MKYYSEQNGFRNTEIFVADYDNMDNWCKLKSNPSKNININTSARLICLIRTEKFQDIQIKEIFQEIFLLTQIKIKLKIKKNRLIKNTYLSFFSKNLIFMDFISKKINLKKNKNLETKKILDLIN